MLYCVGDSQHTQNVQINKVTGENEKCVFYFTEKTKQTFWPTRYLYKKLFFAYLKFKFNWAFYILSGNSNRASFCVHASFFLLTESHLCVDFFYYDRDWGGALCDLLT